MANRCSDCGAIMENINGFGICDYCAPAVDPFDIDAEDPDDIFLTMEAESTINEAPEESEEIDEGMPEIKPVKRKGRSWSKSQLKAKSKPKSRRTYEKEPGTLPV